MDKIKEERRITDQYHENMRQNEWELEILSTKERKLAEKEQEMFDFKNTFRNYINDGMGYPAEALQLGGVREELQCFEEETFKEVLLEERTYQEEYEDLQIEKKDLLSKEDTYTEEYRKELNKLNGG